MIRLDKDKDYKFLLVRCDRIGDLALSLQCAESIKSEYPNSKVIYLVRSYTEDLLKFNPFVDEVICIDKVVDLVKELKKREIDISISLHADKKSTLSIFRSGIKTRIGNLSGIHSLLFNYKVRQRRSECRKNEGQYNLDLLRPLGISKTFYPKIYIDLREKSTAIEFLEHRFLDFYHRRLIVIHPGSGGSSVDWGAFNYLELANILAGDYNILLTGSGVELGLYREHMSKFSGLSTDNLVNECSLRDLVSIISCADLFVSNSTGPLHCAVAVGVRTVGLYPFRKPNNPVRWGQFNNKMRHYVVTPLGIFSQKELSEFEDSDYNGSIHERDDKRVDMRSISVEMVSGLVRRICAVDSIQAYKP